MVIFSKWLGFIKKTPHNHYRLFILSAHDLAKPIEHMKHAMCPCDLPYTSSYWTFLRRPQLKLEYTQICTKGCKKCNSKTFLLVDVILLLSDMNFGKNILWASILDTCFCKIVGFSDMFEGKKFVGKLNSQRSRRPGKKNF